MKKIAASSTASLVLVCYLLLPDFFLNAQTTQQTAEDTTKKSAQKLPPTAEKPKLELPDVLIYGTDRSVRMTGEKLDRLPDDAKLVSPVNHYQSLINDLKLENNKNYFESQKRRLGSRTFVQLDAGRYQQFNIEAGQSRETENYNYNLAGKYDRSSGQYDNSQYYRGLINAQFGFRVSPDIVISSQGNFQLFDYGLYGAGLEELHRKKTNAGMKAEAQWSLTAERLADFSLSFQQTNCHDEDNNNYSLKSKQRKIGLASSYQTKYRSIPLFVRGLYEYQLLKNIAFDSANTQNFIQLKSWASFKIKQYFVIKPGILFEHLEVNDSLSKYQLWPDLEIIAMPISRLGLLFKVSKEFSPINYADLFEKNPFLSQETNFVPMRKELEWRLGIEYNLSSSLSLSTEIVRQNWQDYAYWYRDSSIGLFRLGAINKVALTILNFQGRFKLSDKANFDAAIQLYFDKMNKDSLSNYGDNLPYLERLRMPFTFEYQIDHATKGLLSLMLVSPRYADLKNDNRLSSFGLLSLNFERQLIKNVAVFVEGNNLLNQKYQIWQNYPAMGIYFGAGIKGNW